MTHKRYCLFGSKYKVNVHVKAEKKSQRTVLDTKNKPCLYWIGPHLTFRTALNLCNILRRCGVQTLLNRLLFPDVDITWYCCLNHSNILKYSIYYMVWV